MRHLLLSNTGFHQFFFGNGRIFTAIQQFSVDRYGRYFLYSILVHLGKTGLIIALFYQIVYCYFTFLTGQFPDHFDDRVTNRAIGFEFFYLAFYYYLFLNCSLN